MFPEGNRCNSQNKAGRGRARKALWVVQGQLETCGSQRAGVSPSPVACRGYRCRVGGGCERYKDREMVGA